MAFRPLRQVQREFSMPKIEIYTSFFCGFCHRAKALLKKKQVAYDEVDVMMHPSKRAEMIQRAGRTYLGAADFYRRRPHRRQRRALCA